MTVNFQEVRNQVQALGVDAPERFRKRQALQQNAFHLLEQYANESVLLCQKVEQVVETWDPNLRCALPLQEALTAHHSLPHLPGEAVILAADGSQILPDRHAQVEFCLINVGAIQMHLRDNGIQPVPQIFIKSRLMYDQELFTEDGKITDARLALMRDLAERKLLAQQAEIFLRTNASQMPLITFTDGTLELWGSTEAENVSTFQKSLEDYLGVLSRLHDLGVTTAGYVDKPSADLIVRLLEVAMLDEAGLAEIKKRYPLRGVTDFDLFCELLSQGERSAVFALQSHSSRQYSGILRLHFFYLNIGRPDHPWIARVEIPAWVAQDASRLAHLHATLVEQCQMMGQRPYPYLLHRAHETACVSLPEKEQVEAMITQELYRQGVKVGEVSYKQTAKELEGRKSYGGLS
jgi:hypothetical protein